jgi:dicarboxylate/amino acid:cation (Na+ or H+) symporter, DAACS family
METLMEKSRNPLRIWFRLALWQQILIALCLGVITGLMLKEKAEALEPIGLTFIRAIQLLVAPVVLTSIVCAILSLSNYKIVGRVMTKAVLIYAISMAVAATIGILVANFLHVGEGLTVSTSTVVGIAAIPSTVSLQSVSFGNILLGIVPNSAIQALADNSVLQILVFAFILGMALKNSGAEGKPVQDLFLSFSKVVFKFCHIIISFAPYGIFALIAAVFGRYGITAFLPLLKLIAAVYLGCIILIVFYYGGVLILCGISPKYFFGNIVSPVITAYTTSSSAATLPITMRTAKEDLKLDPNISDFMLPLGTSLNLNGLSIYLSVAAIFSAHIFGITLNFYQYIGLVASIVVIAAGAAAIPGSALVVMDAIMQSSGIPLGALPLIAGVDRFNDMAQTTTNVIGDLFAATIVAKGGKLSSKERSALAHTAVTPAEDEGTGDTKPF